MKLKNIIISFIVSFFLLFIFACSNNNDKGNTNKSVDDIKGIIEKEETNLTINRTVTENGKTETIVIKLEGTSENNEYTSYKLSLTNEGEEIYYELKDSKYIAITKDDSGEFVGKEIQVRPSVDMLEVKDAIIESLSKFTYDASTSTYNGTITIDGETGEVTFKVENDHLTYIEVKTTEVKTVCNLSGFGTTRVNIPTYLMAGTNDGKMSLTEWNAMLQNTRRNYTYSVIEKRYGEVTTIQTKFNNPKKDDYEVYYNYNGDETYFKIIDGELFAIEFVEEKWQAMSVNVEMENPLAKLFDILLSSYSSFTYDRKTDTYNGTVFINNTKMSNVTLKVVNEKINQIVIEDDDKTITTDISDYGTTVIDYPEFVYYIPEVMTHPVSKVIWNVLVSEINSVAIDIEITKSSETQVFQYLVESEVDATGKLISQKVFATSGDEKQYFYFDGTNYYMIALNDNLEYEMVPFDKFSFVPKDLMTSIANYSHFKYNETTELYEYITYDGPSIYVQLKDNHVTSIISVGVDQSIYRISFSNFGIAKVDLPEVGE